MPVYRFESKVYLANRVFCLVGIMSTFVNCSLSLVSAPAYILKKLISIVGDQSNELFMMVDTVRNYDAFLGSKM